MGAKQIFTNRRLYMLVAVVLATLGIIGYASFAGTDSGSKTDAIISTAKTKLENDFAYGAEGETKFDGSGFVYWVFEKQNGIKLGTQRGAAADYFSTGIEVKKDELKKGDLVFFSYNQKEATQVGIYVEGNNFITASPSYGKVTVLNFNSHLANPVTKKEDINRKTYNEIFFGARRILGTSAPKAQVTELKKGDSNSSVAALQQDLNTIGYRVEKSEVYDDQTEAAVTALQGNYGVTQNGICTAQVKEIISELKNARVAKALIP